MFGMNWSITTVIDTIKKGKKFFNKTKKMVINKIRNTHIYNDTNVHFFFLKYWAINVAICFKIVFVAIKSCLFLRKSVRGKKISTYLTL